MAWVTLQKGGAAGGRMECDGKRHRYVYADYKAYGLPETLPMGRCPNPEHCKQKAALLAQEEKEAEERLARAMAEMKAKQKPAAPPAISTTSPAPVKEG